MRNGKLYCMRCAMRRRADTANPLDCHGSSWQKEMFRINELGAQGMKAEAQSYAKRLAEERRK